MPQTKSISGSMVLEALKKKKKAPLGKAPFAPTIPGMVYPMGKVPKKIQEQQQWYEKQRIKPKPIFRKGIGWMQPL